MDRPEGGPGSSTETRLRGHTSSNSDRPLLQQTAKPVEAADWVKGALETLAVLREWFPLAFAGRPRPLKRGVHRDLIERASAITPREIARALRYHTQGKGYLLSMRSGAPRLDLDGCEVGVVSPDEAAKAKGTLKLRRERKAARLRAATPMQAPPPPLPPAPAVTKQQRELSQALKDRERYRRARGLRVRV